MRETVFEYIKKKYKVYPEYAWAKYDSNAVFCHADNKWFALVIDVQRDKLVLHGDEYVDVINLKVDDMFFGDMLIRQNGILPAYHMNKQHWITVLLDGTVPNDKVFDLINMSFMATASKKKKEKIRGPKGANRPVDDCVRCGHCNSWCPFVVVQMNKMQEIKDYFGE